MEYYKILDDIGKEFWQLVIVIVIFALILIIYKALQGKFDISIRKGEFSIKYIGPKAK